MSNLKHRLGLGARQPTGATRIPRVEYVNRAGQLVNPRTGKPYDKPNFIQNDTKNKGKRKLPMKLVGVMFGGLDPISTDPRIDPPPRVCFNCWQPGHAKRNCPRPNVALICNNCGRRGVDLNTCPRCRRAHIKHLEGLRGKQRGGDIGDEEFDEQLLPGEEEDFVNESSDDILRNLIYQDERARELRQLDFERKRELEMLKEKELMYHNDYQDRRRFEESTFSDRVVNPLYQEKSRNHIEQEVYYREEREDSRQRSYHEDEDLRKNSESSIIDSSTKYNIAAASSSSGLTDPVHDVLALAKSISHLSPETQELIMLQVMAERREHAKLKAMQHKNDDDDDDDDDPWS